MLYPCIANWENADTNVGMRQACIANGKNAGKYDDRDGDRNVPGLDYVFRYLGDLARVCLEKSQTW